VYRGETREESQELMMIIKMVALLIAANIDHLQNFQSSMLLLTGGPSFETFQFSFLKTRKGQKEKKNNLI
jgi:hypothetical protein